MHDRSDALFASLQVGYKDFLYINMGGRKEWQYLWKEGTRESYDDVFYPSAGLSFIPTSIISHSDVLSFLKLRLAYSESGNFHQYCLPNDNRDMTALVQGSFFSDKTKSYEAGVDLGLFNNKLNLSFTMYTTSTDNEIPMETYSVKAEIQNKGLEVSLGLNQDLGPVSWNSSLTYTLNKIEFRIFLKS